MSTEGRAGWLFGDDDAFLHLIESRLAETNQNKDALEERLERSAVLSAIDYAMKRWSTRGEEAIYRDRIDRLLKICHENGFTPLYQITGSEDIKPETIRYSPDRSLLSARCDMPGQLHLIRTSDMRCITTFSISDCGIIDHRISQNLRYLAIMFSHAGDCFICVSDLTDLRVISIIDDVPSGSVFCIRDTGGLLHSDGEWILSSNDEDMRIECPSPIENLIQLDQNRILAIGVRSAIVTVDGVAIECEAGLSKDSHAFIRDDAIHVLSGCTIYSISFDGKIINEKDLSEHIGVPLKTDCGLNRYGTPSAMDHDGKVLNIHIREGNMDCRLEYEFDLVNGLGFAGYELHGSFESSDDSHAILDGVLEEYRGSRPYRQADLKAYLLEHDCCFAFHHGGCHHFKVVQRGASHLRILRTSFDLSLPIMDVRDAIIDYDVMIRLIGHPIDPSDGGNWTPSSIETAEDGTKLYLKDAGGLIHLENGFPIVSDEMLDRKDRWQLAIDHGRCIAVAPTDNGLLYVCDGRAISIEDAKCHPHDRGFVKHPELFCRDGSIHRVRSDLSVEHLGEIPFGFEAISVSDESVLFRKGMELKLMSKNDSYHQKISYDRIDDMQPLDERHAAIILCRKHRGDPSENPRRHERSLILLDMRDGTEREYPIPIHGYECIGIHGNHRFDLARIDFNKDHATVSLAEVKPDGSFRERSDIVLQCGTHHRDGNNLCDADAFVTVSGANIVLLHSQKDDILLKRYRIEKGLKDTNNVLKASRSRFLCKSFNFTDDCGKCMVYSTSSSNDSTDRRHRGFNSPEVRIVDMKTGMRSKAVFHSVRGYKAGAGCRTMLIDDGRHLLAECISENDGMTYVNLWDCENGKRYPVDDPVCGRMMDADDDGIHLLEKSDHGGFCITYDRRMNMKCKRDADATPDASPYHYICRRKDLIHNQKFIKHVPAEGDVFWKLEGFSEADGDDAAGVPLVPTSHEQKSKNMHVKLMLHTLRHGVMTDGIQFETILHVDESRIEESIDECLAMSSFNGVYAIQRLVRESRGQVREESSFETILTDGIESDMVKGSMNPFNGSECRGYMTSYLGEDGFAYIDGEAVSLRSMGGKDRFISVPEGFSPTRVLYADVTCALLCDSDERIMSTDWVEFRMIDMGCSADARSLRHIRANGGRHILAGSYDTYVLDMEGCRMESYEDAILGNRVFEEVTKGVYISRLV